MERKTILLVDDEALFRSAMKDILALDYDILEASNYSEAILYSERPIDLAIIDYSLSGKDGFEVLRAIREKKTSLPAIIMTAFSTKNVAIQAIKAGVTDYIEKPFSLRYLMKRVSEILYGTCCDVDGDTIKNRHDFMIENVVIYIEKRYMEEDLTLGKIAGMAHMDKYSFCREFKKRIGHSFTSYLNSVRLKNAAELLEGDLNISEIAYYIGCRNVGYFNRLFKKKFGISPGEYRKSVAKRTLYQ